MPTTKYVIDYQIPPDKALRGLDAIVGGILKAEKHLDRFNGKLKSMGQNMPGLAMARGHLQKLEAILKAQVSAAEKAEGALKKVGSDNRSVASLTTRIEKLKAELAGMEAQALSAQAALATVGGGVTLPRGGGAGGGTGGGGAGVAGLGISKLHAGLAAARTATRLARAGAEGWEGQLAFFKATGEQAGTYRESLREVANLTVGGGVVTDAVMKGQLDFQKQTGMNADEARTFREQYLGAISTGKQRGNITDAVANDLEAEAGRFSVRYHLDPMTAGKMAGLVGEYQKVDSAAVGVGVMAEAAEHLNRYGVGQVRQMMGPMVGLQGEMVDENGGRFKSIPALAATYAATTARANPARAATQIRQANNALRRFSDEDTGNFLRGVGINEDTPYEEAIRKIAPLITGPKGDLVLSNAGFGSQWERRSLISQAKLIPVIDANLEDKSKVVATARDQAIQMNRNAQGSLEGRKRESENAEFEAEVTTGMQMERLQLATEAAIGRMSDNTQPGGQRLKAGFGGSLKDKARSALTLGAMSGEDIRIGVEANEGLIRGGKAVGIDVAKAYPNIGTFTNPDARSRDFSAAYDAITARGGDPLGNAAANLKAGAALIARGANQLGGPGAAGPGPGPGNGGAGVNPRRP